MGYVAERRGDIDLAMRHATAAYELFSRAGQPAGQVNAINGIGWCNALLGQYERGVACCHQALALVQQVGDIHAEAPTWDSLGYAHHQLGHYDEAVTAYDRSLSLYRRLGNRYCQADVLHHLGESKYAAGDAGAAGANWRQAHAGRLPSGQRPDVPARS